MSPDNYPTYRVDYFFPGQEKPAVEIPGEEKPTFDIPGQEEPTFEILRAMNTTEARRQIEENMPGAVVTTCWLRAWPVEDGKSGLFSMNRPLKFYQP